MGTEGPLALVGGDEFRPGNEPIDSVLAEGLGGGDAFVLATAAARQGPRDAVGNAQRWFGDLGLQVEELPATSAAHVADPDNVARARAGRFFYLVGGDPGLVLKLLGGTPLWRAIADAWHDGAALAGSSAGAMALGGWSLIRNRMPGDRQRLYRNALEVVPGIAVIPHFDTFGSGWVPSAIELAPDGTTLLGLDERTAAVWTRGAWLALGDGNVTVIDREGRRSSGRGEVIAGLPMLGA